MTKKFPTTNPYRFVNNENASQKPETAITLSHIVIFLLKLARVRKTVFNGIYDDVAFALSLSINKLKVYSSSVSTGVSTMLLDLICRSVISSNLLPHR